MGNWRENVRSVVPYVPGEQPQFTDMIKLNTNENPYPPAPGVMQALQAFDGTRLRMYPDPNVTELQAALAEFYGVRPEQIFVGVGSDDVLAMSFLTFFNSEKPVFFPDITYSFYDVWADLLKIPYERKPLDPDFRIRTEDYEAENGGVVIANPNAPTGLLLAPEEMEQILSHNRDVVVIADEAYIDFGGTSALPLLQEYDNLLVVRTFSKSRALAGSRVGFAIGNPELIRCLWDARNSFNSYTMDAVTQKAAAAAVRDRAYFEETCRRIVRTREEAKKRLAALSFTFPDSKTNFLFIRHRELPAEKIFEALRARHIFVRHFNGERIHDYLRVTIGTDEQMEALYRALEEIEKE